MLSPVIFGEIMLPSTCCNKNSHTHVHRAVLGDTKSATTIAGKAPNKGPKYGIILKIAFSKDKITGKFTCSRIKIIKVITPMIKLKNN